MVFNVTCVNGTNVNCTSGKCMPCPLADGAFTVFAQIRIIIYAIAFILSLIGNGTVMLVTLKKIRSKIPVPAFTALLTHLAFVDLLFSCNAFILIPNEIHNEESFNGVPLCKFKKLFRQTPFMAAIGTITVIAVERYLGITSHISRKWTHKRVFISLFVIWVFSFLIYIPNVHVIKVRANGRNCYEDWSLTSRRINAVCIALAEYVIPLTIIAFCNYKIIRVIRERRKAQLEKFGDVPISEQQLRDQKKTVRILIAVVLGFAVLCLPNQILFFYAEVANKTNTASTVHDVLQMLGVLLVLHTSFNPAVYSVMDRAFRQDAKELFRSCCCCCCSCCKKSPDDPRGSTSTGSDQTKSTRTNSRLSANVMVNAV